MSLLHKNHAFDSASQLLDHAPDSIRLISDRVLIRDLGDPSQIGSIIIPETARDKARDEWGIIRLGVIIASGPGDRFIECGLTEEHEVRRKAIVKPCKCPSTHKYFDIVNYCVVNLGAGDECPNCHGTGIVPLCVEPQCRIGMQVLYSRRREAEVYMDGVMHSLVNAEQSVLAWYAKTAAQPVRPLYDRIIVRRSEVSTMTESLHIPGNAQEKPREGIVLAVGRGKAGIDGEMRLLAVEHGDRILFGEYAGTEFTSEGDTVLIMREREVLAVVE